MEPILISFHAPHHDLDLVARNVVREGVSEQLLRWKRQSGARELVYMSTCQRVLWMLWDGDPASRGLGSDARIYRGEAAWSHVLGVASGLESANLGDREIVDQLGSALQKAREVGSAGPEAQAAIEDLVREAQRLRAKLGLADGTVSVATAALKHLDEALPKGSAVAIVGVGPMSQYLAERLPERGYRVAVANRTESKAEVLGCPTVPLAQLVKDPVGFDAIVTATTSAKPLFTLEQWGGLRRPPLRLLDLALPHDSEPALEQLPWVHRIDLSVFLAETATARSKRMEAAQQAEPFMLGAVTRLRRRAASRAQRRHLATAQDRLETAWESLESELNASGHPLAEISPEQQEALQTLLRRGRTLSFRALVQSQPVESM